jgi:hypothetical protein
VDNEEKQRICEFYVELGSGERHFNNLQTTYRTFASTWLLAAFAATGFVLSMKTDPAIPRGLLVSGIGLGAGVGIYLLWLIDLVFYQRLLSAFFQEAEILERKYEWLPQVRRNMRYLAQEKGAFAVRWFYIVATALMALLGWLGLLLWLLGLNIPRVVVLGVATLITIAYVIGIGVLQWHMRRRNPTPTRLVPRLKRLREQAEREGEA